MAARLLLCALCAAVAAADRRARGAAAAQVTPLQKVVQMLEDVKAKGKQEKQAEETEFSEFQEWCEGVRAAKTKSIKEAEAQIMQLQADIQKAEADAETLSGEIADLEATISKAEAEVANATSVRKREKADYLTEHADLSESIDACQRAVSTLQARSADVPQSLAQLRASSAVPSDAKAVISAFLATQSESGREARAPEANAYEFQAGGVVALLEKLELKFKDQLLVLEKEEINSKSSYEVLMQRLTDDIKEDKATVMMKTKAKAARLDDAAVAKGDLQTTEATKAEDEKTLSDTTAECQARSEEFEKNQVTRAAEVKAIEQAVEILSSDAVSGNAATYLPAALLQASTSAGRALAQLQGGRHAEQAARQRVVDLLQAQARRLKSRFLALAASRAAADPFAKVKTMVQELIFKLKEQANAEADSHAYCQTELATNKQTRTNKASEVEELTATSEELAAESVQLTDEITELSDAIAEIKGQQAEATKMRGEEKATNAKTVADAKVAQAAVAKATQVLREFYAKSAEASFMQSAQGNEAGSVLRGEMSQAGKAPYKGMQDTSTGIFGMLEVVLSDFVRLETETQQAEEAAATSYQKFMDESNESVAVKEKAVEHKTSKKALVDEKARSTERDLKLTQEELDKASAYRDTLKTQCVDAGFSYEERVKAREAEIQSLREALEVLDQSNLALSEPRGSLMRVALTAAANDAVARVTCSP
eukprot:CAMPEP_0171197546 /NCGR_PEP_ID=MMETSP0790-20130122/22468_1 /TAXON_ID=2925 /ORGANISM="Alexandrium catenella, Strain OF101" /LENGTH=713 /DNA_ID=CAMNT_0011662793 /DNA_START=80 /DNA_END=2217 /DNA_ORIENTATION=-